MGAPWLQGYFPVHSFNTRKYHVAVKDIGACKWVKNFER